MVTASLFQASSFRLGFLPREEDFRFFGEFFGDGGVSGVEGSVGVVGMLLFTVYSPFK